jgi:hypothetical protein
MIWQAEGKRPFDFEHEKFRLFKREETKKFLIENHANPITEDQYLEVMREIRLKDPLPGKTHRTHRTPSYIRREYQRLVERYGFFPGGQNE